MNDIFLVEFKYERDRLRILNKSESQPWKRNAQKMHKFTMNWVLHRKSYSKFNNGCHLPHDMCTRYINFFAQLKSRLFSRVLITHMNRFSTRINQDHPDRPMNDFTIRYFSDFVRFSKFSRKFSLIGKTCHAARSLWKIFCFFSICSIIKKLKFTFTLSRHYTHIARIFPGIYGF